MNIGQLRQRLTLQSASAIADGSGGLVTSWTNLKDVWGALQPLSTSQLWQQDGNRQATHRVTLRYDSAVQTGMRLQANSRNFLIHALTVTDDRRRWLELLVEEQSELG
jgi:SPP1 family predicted phage head-tail adaptor